MRILILSLIFFLLSTLVVRAADFNSSNYQVRDPVINPATFASSSNFKLFGVLAQPSVGTSSASSYEVKAGFLYFPIATAPSVTATPGDSTVTLTWSASTGFLGWSVSSYSVGKSTVPGGPYTYSNVGNVLTSTMGSLTNSTTYYFVVRAKDYFGNFIATSSEVSATPVAGTSGGGTSSGGGNGPIISYIPPLTKPQQEIKECRKIADLNCDGYVDIVDFSIMYYWYEKSNPPIRVDLKVDGTINIFDFSVMAYYWYERNEN